VPPPYLYYTLYAGNGKEKNWIGSFDPSQAQPKQRGGKRARAADSRLKTGGLLIKCRYGRQLVFSLPES